MMRMRKRDRKLVKRFRAKYRLSYGDTPKLMRRLRDSHIRWSALSHCKLKGLQVGVEAAVLIYANNICIEVIKNAEDR